MKRTKPVVPVSALEQAVLQGLQMTKTFNERFVVDDDFLPEHPDREAMIDYLKTKSWRGTETGAAQYARVSLKRVREWKKLPEFTEWEALADEACTDLIEEVALAQAYFGGEKSMLQTTLKARRATYADKQEITGKNGGPVEFKIDLGTVPRPQRLD